MITFFSAWTTWRLFPNYDFCANLLVFGFFFLYFVFWGTENTASHGLRINHISDVTWKSYLFFFFRSWVYPDELFILSIFSCISKAIFYISSKQLWQKFCFSFIIILLCILVCLSVTMTTEGSSNIFTLSLSF